MKLVKRSVVLKYVYNQLTGNFAGFLIGMSASSLVSQFFETRSLRNLWGLTSKKTLIDKDTFQNLEWIISLVIGFIVFEIFTKVVKERMDRNFPLYKYRLLRWMVTNEWHTKLRSMSTQFRTRRAALTSTVNTSFKNAVSKYSKR